MSPVDLWRWKGEEEKRITKSTRRRENRKKEKKYVVQQPAISQPTFAAVCAQPHFSGPTMRICILPSRCVCAHRGTTTPSDPKNKIKKKKRHSSSSTAHQRAAKERNTSHFHYFPCRAVWCRIMLTIRSMFVVFFYFLFCFVCRTPCRAERVFSLYLLDLRRNE